MSDVALWKPDGDGNMYDRVSGHDAPYDVGPFVSYDDYAALKNELAALKGRLNTAESLVDRYRKWTSMDDKLPPFHEEAYQFCEGDEG